MEGRGLHLGYGKLVNILLLFACVVFYIGGFWGGLSDSPQIKDAIEAFINCYIVLAIIRHLFLFVGTIVFRVKTKLLEKKVHNYEPFVSVIVPAFNEESVIRSSLKNLLNLNYENYEVIVVDDGSTDATSVKAYYEIEQTPHASARLLVQANGGKASALNYGIRAAKGDLILCVDADSRLSKDSIKHAVKHFIDPQVAAVSGFVRLISKKNFLLRFQDLEYALTLNFVRPALALSGSVTIVPGPAGMFRKSALEQVNGYDTKAEVFAEDADLTIRLLANNWKVTSESGLLSQTEAPENLKTVLQQRYRWNRGILQAIKKNLLKILMLEGIRGKAIAMYLVFDAYIMRLVNFGLTTYFLGNFFATGQVNVFTKWFMSLVLIDALIIVFASTSMKEYLSHLATMLFSRFSYAFILTGWGVYCLVDECFSTSMSWDKLERTDQIGAMQ